MNYEFRVAVLVSSLSHRYPVFNLYLTSIFIKNDIYKIPNHPIESVAKLTSQRALKNLASISLGNIYESRTN